MEARLPWTVHVALSGRTFELQCGEGATVHELQQTLGAITGIQPADQVLTCDGTLLSPTSPLPVQRPSPGSPADGFAPSATSGCGFAREIFLYSKPLLRMDAPFPPSETLPLPVPGFDGSDPTPPVAAGNEPHLQRDDATSGKTAAKTAPDDDDNNDNAVHPLESAASPLLRALPQYRREFLRHAQRASVAAEAAAARVALCARFIEESETRALCVDAAMASVEPSYEFICTSQASFQQHFRQRYHIHEDVLSHFEADVAFLRSIELPTKIRDAVPSSSSGGGGAACLADLIDVDALKLQWKECSRAHRRFAARVSELEGLHNDLRNEVEALFMRAPSVDLPALAQGLRETQNAADEQAAIAQAMHADLKRAEAALEEGNRSAPLVSPGVRDAISVLEAVHEAHTSNALVRVEECAHSIERYAQRCVIERNALADDALRALRTIAAQQSKIRAMKEALAPFPEALKRQDAQIERLLIVRRLPVLYKQCLAECARRSAFADKYSTFAADLAERMGSFRIKELDKRDTFKARVENLLPAELLSAMGLTSPPPHCVVTIAGDDRTKLLPVTADDLRRMQLPTRGPAASASASASSLPAVGREQGGSSSALESSSATMSQSQSPRAMPGLACSPKSAAMAGVDEGDYGMSRQPASRQAGITKSPSLVLENAHLREELASYIVQQCNREADIAAYMPTMREGEATPPPQGSTMDVQQGYESGSTNPATSTTLTTTSTSGGGVSGTGYAKGMRHDDQHHHTSAVPPSNSKVVANYQRALAAKDALIATLNERIAESERDLEHAREKMASMERKDTAAQQSEDRQLSSTVEDQT